MGASLERIFIEHRIYKLRTFEEAPDQQTALDVIRKALEPIVGDSLLRPITNDDLARLLEIKMARILKFNLEKNEQLILRLTEEMAQIQHHLGHLTDYTIHYYSSVSYTHLECLDSNLATTHTLISRECLVAIHIVVTTL